MFKHLLFNQSSINVSDSWNSGLVDSVYSSTVFGNTDVPVDVPQIRAINPFGTSAALPASSRNSDISRRFSKIFFLHF